MPSFWIQAKALPNGKRLVSMRFLVNSLLRKTIKCLEKQNTYYHCYYLLKKKLAILGIYLK